MNTEAIISKIKKLLALASDPGVSPGEADNATRQASRMMLKHQINEAMLEADTCRIRCGFGYTQAIEPKWCGPIAIGVAEFMGTIVQWTNKQQANGEFYKCFKFGGEINDVRFSIWLTETLFFAAERAVKNRKDKSEHGKTFLNGYATAIYQRLYAMAKAKEETANEVKAESSTALLVLDQKQSEVSSKFGQQTKSPYKGKIGIQGYVAGQNAVIPTGALEQNATVKQLS